MTYQGLTSGSRAQELAVEMDGICFYKSFSMGRLKFLMLKTKLNSPWQFLITVPCLSWGTLIKAIVRICWVFGESWMGICVQFLSLVFDIPVKCQNVQCYITVLLCQNCRVNEPDFTRPNKCKVDTKKSHLVKHIVDNKYFWVSNINYLAMTRFIICALFSESPYFHVFFMSSINFPWTYC